MRTLTQDKKARFIRQVADAIIESDSGVESIEYVTREEKWPAERIEIRFGGAHSKPVFINTTGNSNGLNLEILHRAIFGPGAIGEFDPDTCMAPDETEERS